MPLTSPLGYTPILYHYIMLSSLAGHTAGDINDKYADVNSSIWNLLGEGFRHRSDAPLPRRCHHHQATYYAVSIGVSIDQYQYQYL